MADVTPVAMSMVLVDLPNFYNGLVAAKLCPPDMIKRYFLDWLDLDLLSSTISPLDSTDMGTWIFYSLRAMGPRALRIEKEELEAFIERQDCIEGVSSLEVGIRGKQNESYRPSCEKCGDEVERCKCGGKIITRFESEKGIDSSLITHLFETIDSWATATILSQDSDYSPAVRALRRKGKIVYGAGFSKRASGALIRECYGYKDVLKEYLLADLELFSVFQKDGSLSKFVKKARGINKTSVRRALIPSLRGGGATFELRVIFCGAGPVGDKDNRECFVKLAHDINKEFQCTWTQLEDTAPTELKILMHLNQSQKMALIRAAERYIDFPILRNEEEA